MSRPTRRVNLLRHETKPGTTLAYGFVRRDNDAPIWIPKSLIQGISMRTPPDLKGMCLVIVTVEEWFADKNDL